MKRFLFVVSFILLVTTGCSFGNINTNSKEYDVVFSIENGVTGNFSQTLKFQEGEEFTLPESPFSKEGFTFKNWIIDGEVYLPGNKYIVKNKNIVVQLQWKKDVTFDVEDYDSVLNYILFTLENANEEDYVQLISKTTIYDYDEENHEDRFLPKIDYKWRRERQENGRYIAMIEIPYTFQVSESPYFEMESSLFKASECHGDIFGVHTDLFCATDTYYNRSHFVDEYGQMDVYLYERYEPDNFYKTDAINFLDENGSYADNKSKFRHYFMNLPSSVHKEPIESIINGSMVNNENTFILDVLNVEHSLKGTNNEFIITLEQYDVLLEETYVDNLTIVTDSKNRFVSILVEDISISGWYHRVDYTYGRSPVVIPTFD